MSKIKVLIIIFLIPLLWGCQKEEKKKTEPKKIEFELKTAENTVIKYMNLIIENNIEGSKKMYSEELQKEEKVTELGNLKLTGFILDESSRVGESAMIKLKATRINEGKPFTVLDSYTIKVIKEGEEYKISKINTSQEKECFLEQSKVRLRDKNDVKTNLVISLDGIPQYAIAKEDKANLLKIKVAKDGFGAIAFNYNGERMAFSTTGSNCYYGVVNIDPSLATQGGGEGGGGAGAGGDSEDKSSGDGNKTPAREKPIGKEIISFDILSNSEVEKMIFSGDEKYVAVQYKNKDNERSIKVYDSKKGEPISFIFEDNFNKKDKDVVFKMYNKEVLNFQVIEKNKKVDGKPLVKEWELDLKSFKAKEV